MLAPDFFGQPVPTVALHQSSPIYWARECMGMDESSKDDPQNVSSSDAIALTREALRNTRRNLRESDRLLERAKGLSNHANEEPRGAESAADE